MKGMTAELRREYGSRQRGGEEMKKVVVVRKNGSGAKSVSGTKRSPRAGQDRAGTAPRRSSAAGSTKGTNRPLVLVLCVILIAAVILIGVQIQKGLKEKTQSDRDNRPVSSSENKESEPSKATETTAPSTTAAPKPAEMSFDADEHGIYKGDTRKAELLNVPDGGTVKWKSSDKKVVEVDNDGKMTAKKAGTATVTAECGGKSCTLKVTVVKKTPDPALDLPENYEDILKVVNNDNPITADYVPDLVKVRSSIPTAYPKNTNLTPKCEKALAEMYSAFEKQKLGTLRLISTYRSYKKQEELLNKSIKDRKAKGMSEKEARADALKTRQAPGCSEHQLGVSIDFSTGYNTDRSFHKTKQGKWLTKNAWRYGFVLRYPSDKVKKTGINYEPWHFRYVGTEHSKYIYDHSLCLEEYVELQKKAKESAEEYAAAHPLD